MLYHKWGQALWCGQDHAHRWWEPWPAPTPSPSPSLGCRFGSDRQFSFNLFISFIEVWQIWRFNTSTPCAWCHARSLKVTWNSICPSLRMKKRRTCCHLSKLTLGYNGISSSWVPKSHPPPHVICSLQGYLGELVRISGTNITLDGMITVLDEHYNNVKALDTLNQELFQLWMANKETVSDWGVCLSRHLQILAVLIPRKVPTRPHCWSEVRLLLQWTAQAGWRWGWATSRQLLMRRHTWTTFVWAWEAEKEEVMETSQSLALASMSKPKVTSFFPLWKLKGSQLTISPSSKGGTLKEKSANEEEGVDSEDPDDIKGVTEKFIAHLARTVKDTQQMEKHCYHCDSPDHFIHDCPQLAETKADCTFKLERGDSTEEGRPNPSRKDGHTKGAPEHGMPKA